MIAVRKDARAFLVVNDVTTLIEDHPAVSLLVPVTSYKDFLDTALTKEERGTLDRGRDGVDAFRTVAPGEDTPAFVVDLKEYAALTLDTSGTTGTWELVTTGMAPCGYNIRIDGADRTIVNSGFIGWHAADIEGSPVVTEKTAPFLHYPMGTIRQTDEGGVMIGDSQEDRGFDTIVGQPVISVMAERAVRTFPRLAGLNVVRTWSALRVMSPDGFPIYDQSRSHPGAFLVTCHSGVTLAANHVLTLAPAILAGALPDMAASFSARRFHVPVHA